MNEPSPSSDSPLSSYPAQAAEWNRTEVAYPKELRIHDLFTRSAKANPDAIALTFEGQNMTYGELDRRSNQLANFLKKNGAAPNTLIGLSLYRSFEMLIGLLGILKSGAAYVPIDPEYPKDRLAFMLEDAAPKVLLSLSSVIGTLPPFTGNTLCLDTEWSKVAAESTEQPDIATTSDDLCYMIYTSGSTGKPKGSLNAHIGVVNQLLWMQDRYQITPADSVLQKTPFSFDVSVWEFFWPLLVGSRLVIARPGGHQDPAYLTDTIRREKITATSFVPSMLRAFLDDPNVSQCVTLKHTLAIGEALTYDLQQKFFRNMVGDLHNLYGPTEAAVSVTHWTCKRDATSNVVPIGRPCANTTIHILDEKLNPVPVGETGELHIGGIQVGRGYHNRPEISAERFIKDPFSSDPNGKMYKTGDLARWLPDGELDYLGRIDFQVKVRGFRIELGEIECILALHTDIQQAVVVANRRPEKDDRLVAYLKSKTGQRPSLNELREHVGSRLPEYMVPSLFIWVDEIPLLPNGKVDRKKLPAPTSERPALGRPYVAPRTPLEKQLIALWEELIGVEGAGVDDTFFELGGTSLMALRMVSLWKRQTNEELPVVKVFQYPTVAQLAHWMENKDADKGFLAEEERRAARLRNASGRDGRQLPMAIIGMAGRFPGADDIATLWKNLLAGVESIQVFSREEMGLGIDETLRNDPDYIPARGIIEGAENFDAGFFGIGELEAKVMDPQQRVFLELAYHALENAGIDPERPPGPIAVFAGSGDNRYFPINLLSNPKLLARAGKLAVEYGNEKDYMAMRVSYLLGLNGPSVSSNTGCSSALLAVDQALRALADFECDVALAGGIDIGIPQKSGFLYEEGGTFAKDGHCRPFDADATGTMFCDGAGLVVLKRLDEAIAARDTIHAVVVGTAKNNNGSRSVSFLAPSVEGQAEVIAMAQTNAGVPVDTIGYIEAHGTGTPVGDPIEIEALNQVFRAKTKARGYSYLGSIKGNIGHPTSAAGIAGFLKAALVLEHEQIPATMHFKKLNPKIDLSDSPFRIADKLLPYPRGATPRRAAVSSFGFGGTNVHAILEEAPLLPPGGPTRRTQLVVVSGRTATAASAYAEKLAARFASEAELDFADAASTLLRGRRQLSHRRFVVAPDRKDAAAQLREPNPLRSGSRHTQRRNPPVAFLFGGQGTQYVNMGHELYEDEPLFRALIDECCELLKPGLGRDLRELLYPKKGDEETARESLQNTRYTQPAIFTLSYAMARWWQSLGIQPAIMAGHSVGEFVAATLAGVFELPDALRLIAARGRLMQALPGGSMLSVRAPAKDVEPLLPPDIQLAAVNGPKLCVVAGPTSSIDAFTAACDAKGIVAKKLHTSHAFHSAMVEPIVAPLREEVAHIKLRAPSIPIISTVTGLPMTEAEACNPDYWASHARRTVRYSDAAQWLVDHGHDLFIECGPRATLCTLTRQHVPAGKTISAFPSLGESVETLGELTSVFTALGSLWTHGVTVDWEAFYAYEERRKIPLPDYPFERQRYWVDPVIAGPAAAPALASVEVEAETSDCVCETPAVSETPASAPSAGTRKEQISAKVTELLAQIAGRDAGSIDPAATFLDQGFDSLLLVQVSNALRNELSVKVPFSALMNQHPNVGMLVAHLVDILPPTAFAPVAAAPAAPAKPAAQPAKVPAAPARAKQSATSDDSDLRALVAEQGRALSRILALLENQGCSCTPVANTGSRPSGSGILPTIPQRGIFLSSRLSDRLSASYNESTTLYLDGRIDRSRLELAIQRLVDRHDALRASFDESGNAMRFAPSALAAVAYKDLTSQSAEMRAQALQALIAEESGKAFALPGGPLFRAVIAHLQADKAAVILTGHHVICDGWALDVLVHDFCAFYSAALEGTEPKLHPVQSYGDYVRFNVERESQPEFAAARAHYERLFANGFPALVLPTTYPRATRRTFDAERLDVLVPAERVAVLKAFAAKNRCSLFAVTLAAYGIALARASGQKHFVISLPSAEQPVLGQLHLVGHCVNMLPFEIDLRGDRPFADYLNSLREQLAKAHDYSPYTITHLVGRLRATDPQPGVRSLTVGLTSTQKWKLADLPQKGFTVDFEFNAKRFESFEFYLNAFERGPELLLRAHFDTSLFDEALAGRWLRDVEAILVSLPEKVSTPVSTLLAEKAVPVPGAKEVLFVLGEEIVNQTADSIEISNEATPRRTSGPGSAPEVLEPYVLGLWSTVLKRSNPTPTENFFDSGGNSLNAASLFAEIRRDLGVAVPLAFFYTQTPTPRGLAKWLSDNGAQLGVVATTSAAPSSVFVPNVEKKSFFQRLFD